MHIYSIPDSCALLGISKPTFWRWRKRKNITLVQIEIDARFRYLDEASLVALADEFNRSRVQITKLRAEVADLRERVIVLEESAVPPKQCM